MAGVKRGRGKGNSPWGAAQGGGGGEAGTEYLFFPLLKRLPLHLLLPRLTPASQAKFFVNQDLENSRRSSEFAV